MSQQVGFLTKDLFFPARVRGEVERCGARLIIGPSSEVLIDRLDRNHCPIVLIDLTIAGLDIAATASAFRSKLPSTRLLGFGPHVDTDLLAAAREYFDEAMPRSQFERSIGTLMEDAIGKE